MRREKEGKERKGGRKGWRDKGMEGGRKGGRRSKQSRGVNIPQGNMDPKLKINQEFFRLI